MARKFFILRDIVFLYDDNEANTFLKIWYLLHDEKRINYHKNPKRRPGPNWFRELLGVDHFVTQQ